MLDGCNPIYDSCLCIRCISDSLSCRGCAFDVAVILYSSIINVGLCQCISCCTADCLSRCQCTDVTLPCKLFNGEIVRELAAIKCYIATIRCYECIGQDISCFCILDRCLIDLLFDGDGRCFLNGRLCIILICDIITIIVRTCHKGVVYDFACIDVSLC